MLGRRENNRVYTSIYTYYYNYNIILYLVHIHCVQSRYIITIYYYTYTNREIIKIDSPTTTSGFVHLCMCNNIAFVPNLIVLGGIVYT